MVTEISITVTPDKEKNQSYIRSEIIRTLQDKGQYVKGEEVNPVFIKKSVDARHGKVKLVLRYRVYIGESPEDAMSKIPDWKKADGNKSVIIVGSGPAGLFGALKLLEYGIKPIIIERGSVTSQRKRDIASISTQGLVGENSNYCFGEGGAGTFSDGKLYTRSNKRGSIDSILLLFHYFGADKKITTDAHPHIGTDKLPSIINSMRNKIIELGGEVYFDTKVVDLVTSKEDKALSVKGVKAVNTRTGEEKIFSADAVLLATGHSASDIYEMLARISPESLEAKTFAVGVRVEHPRELIDNIQYHGKKHEGLGAAEYRLVCQQDGRGVYSFCMCPGGFVVPSATGPDEIVVNGMSAAGRNSKWSNAAIVVETRPEDIPEEFVAKAESNGAKSLAGLYWRQWLENLAYQNGDGQKAPCQTVTDFMAHTKTSVIPASSYTPGLVSSRLDQWLPPQVADRIHNAFFEFDRNMKGYVTDKALMIGVETRTSTPVRIVRNKDTGECVSLSNLYPTGEGAGYSGGIVSSAMDGVNMCTLLAEKLLKS